jgi:hypothetical protein
LYRHFLAEHSALRILLAPPDVFLHAINALDQRLASLAIDSDHATALAAVVPRNDFDSVSSAN